jgi:hypothetical protein
MSENANAVPRDPIADDEELEYLYRRSQQETTSTADSVTPCPTLMNNRAKFLRGPKPPASVSASREISKLA